MKGKKRLDFAQELEIPRGIAGGYFMEIRAGKEAGEHHEDDDEKDAVLSGKCDVLTFDDSVLKVKCDEHMITFSGNGLSIDLYTADEISVSGNICMVELD